MKSHGAERIVTEKLQIKEPGNDKECFIGFDEKTHDVLINFKKRGMDALTLGIFKSGGAYISFFDGSGRVRLKLGVFPETSDISGPANGADRWAQGIKLVGSDEKSSLELGVLPADKPYLRLTDQHGRDLVSLLRSSDDRSMMSFFDSEGRPAIQLGTADRGSRIKIQDENGKSYEIPERAK